MMPEKSAWTNRAMLAIAAATGGLLAWAIAGLASETAPATWRPAERGGDARTAPADPGSRPALAERAGSGAHALSGTVVDAGGTPVASAQIIAELELGPGVTGEPPPGSFAERIRGQEAGLEPAGAVVGVSGEDGGFSLRGLDAGRYRLRIEGEGIVTAEVRFVEVPSSEMRLVVAREVSVRGRVTAANGQGVGGVRVELAGDAGQPPVVAETEADGAFAIDGLSEGVFRVWAVHDTDAAAAQTVQRFGAGPFEPVTLVLLPAAIITGRTLDAATGRGIAAMVTLVPDEESSEPARRGQSGVDGLFRIAGVPFGRWTAQAHAPGFIPAEAVTFQAGETSPELTLTRGAVAAGIVVDSDGSPIAGATVSARGKEADGSSREYSQLTVAADAQAFAPGTSAPVARGTQFIPRGELGVVVGPIPFPPRAGAASVRVALPVERPVAIAPGDVPQIPIHPSLASVFVTDSSGRFRMTGLDPGTYRAFAAHPDHADGASEPFTVVLGQEVRDLRIVMSRGTIVFGRITDEAGGHVAGATITASGGGGSLAAVHAVTGLDGNYSMGPFGGDVMLRVSAVGFGPAQRAVHVDARARSRVEREENFSLVRADARLEGRVRDRSGFPLRGATVVVDSAGSGLPARIAVTDEAGRFTVELLPEGEYGVSIDHPDYPRAEARARTGAPAEITLAPGGGIALTVRDASSRAPIAGARVSARGSVTQRAETESTRSGEAELVRLAAGQWTLEVAADGYVTAEKVVAVPAGDRPRAVTVRDVVIELERGATLAGTVRDGNGQRVSGAIVTAGGQTARTDAEGRFRLVDVRVGDVVLEAEKDHRRGQARLTLRPGDELVTIELTLR